LSIKKENLWYEEKNTNTQPKLDPICSAVGKRNMNPISVMQSSFKFPLCNISLYSPDEKRVRETKKWFERLPFHVSKDSNPNLKEFNPPLDMNGKSDYVNPSNSYVLHDINDLICGKASFDSKGLDAPIAAIIWENVFKSDDFFKE